MSDAGTEAPTTQGAKHWTHRHPEWIWWRGEKHWSARLNAETVRRMRREHQSGTSMRALAKRYGVSQACARRAIRGETWGRRP